jgi:hypothetical protein
MSKNSLKRKFQEISSDVKTTAMDLDEIREQREELERRELQILGKLKEAKRNVVYKRWVVDIESFCGQEAVARMGPFSTDIEAEKAVKPFILELEHFRIGWLYFASAYLKKVYDIDISCLTNSNLKMFYLKAFFSKKDNTAAQSNAVPVNIFHQLIMQSLKGNIFSIDKSTMRSLPYIQSNAQESTFANVCTRIEYAFFLIARNFCELKPKISRGLFEGCSVKYTETYNRLSETVPDWMDFLITWPHQKISNHVSESDRQTDLSIALTSMINHGKTKKAQYLILCAIRWTKNNIFHTLPLELIQLIFSHSIGKLCCI